MAGGRPGPALFELIRDKTGTAPPPAPAAPAVVPAPVAAPRVSPETIKTPPTPEPAAASLPDPDRPRPWVIERTEGAIGLSSYAIWIGVAVLVLIVVLVWSWGYSTGYRNADQKAARDFASGQGAGVRDPLKGSIPANPDLIKPDSPKSQPANNQASPKTIPEPKAPPAAAPPGGDPRTPGFNYLLLASKVDGETAQRMVDFLSKNGVPAAAVAKGAAGANNPGPYSVYALEGVTKEQFRSRTPERTGLEDRVHRLGKVWQKEHKGGTDFATATWEKYGS